MKFNGKIMDFFLLHLIIFKHDVYRYLYFNLIQTEMQSLIKFVIWQQVMAPE